ncbi:DNA-binding transcription repressor [Gamsiella multidivaricata]|nr:DNA-binding transcription repressor [Gamsiella multidivaricata]
MDAFQFPATAPSPTQTAISTFRIAQTYPSAAPTASSPLISTSSPTLPATPTAMRSKRKSIPMRSPSWTDSQELSPGVIFQMPFGYLRSAKSPSLTGSEDGTAGNTPPSHYPSPASSIRRSVSGPDVSEHNLFNGQTTPASPLTRSGLGIRVQEDYSEQEATHPLDQPINLSNQDASVEQASVSDESDLGQDPAVNGQGASTAMETDEQISQDSMPTPPSTSTVSATLRMETPNGGTSNPRHVLDTPQSEKAQQNVESIAVSVIVTAMEIATPQPQHASIDLKETDPQREGSKDSPTIAQEDDPSLLPLWAQRWLSIRRQSLIPRNELDFVKGSGILPPPSTDLVIPGGARIKAYPPLLSDFVKFQEELEAKQTEQDSEMAAQNGGSNGGKRRKAGAGKGRGSISTQGARQDDDADEYVGADQIHSTSLKRRRSSHTIQEADVLEEGDFHGPGRGTSRHRRRAHGVDGHGSFSPSISPPAQDEAAYQQNNHASSQPMKLGSPVELSSSTFERGSLRRGPKGKDKLTAKARQTAGGRHDHRDLSWEEPHDIEDEEQYLDGYSDAEGRLRSISNQRRASITASTSGPREKGKGKKDTRLTQKRIGGKNFAVDPNDTEEENSRVEFLQAHDRERYHAGSYGVIPVSEAEFEAIRAREIMDLQRSGRGYHQFKTLKPLLNAIQSEDESVGESSLDGRSRKGNAAGRGGYLNNNINNRVNGGLEAARKRSIQEEVSDLSSSVSKKAKHNITKASRKGGSHADVGTGGPKRGRKAGDARHSIHGSNDESLAMAEALMEMHDGTVDDDETEDEFVPYRGGVDDDHSDSQDDREASGGRLHERVMHQDKAVNQKRANGKMSTPKTLKTAAATAGGTTSPQQPKKKKPTVADPSKLKQHNKAKVSISGAGHHGGSIFSMAGQGFGHGATTTASSKHCEACGANDTPCWRPGYIVNTVLCNSCGLRYKKSNVFCTKVECKYIPLKTEYASMEADRVKHERDHLVCIQCKGRVALPIPKEAS